MARHEHDGRAQLEQRDDRLEDSELRIAVDVHRVLGIGGEQVALDHRTR